MLSLVGKWLCCPGEGDVNLEIVQKAANRRSDGHMGDG